ncbi:MAG TPA: UvrD-helicase domain-containing protein [Acidimicrobiales bacterium]
MTDAPEQADRLLDDLNPAQYDAVTHPEGPLQVIAGAGSGKTRVLTHRIAHLIRDRNVSPFDILAITFTNKAADEMKSRVARLVGPVASKMWVSTFHSACVRILRREAELGGYQSGFTIYDQADAVRLATYVLRDLGADPKRLPPRKVHAAISAAKNEGMSVASLGESARTIFERKVAEVYEQYQARLRRANAMDFDDLLLVTVQIMRDHPDVLMHYQERFGHILVDEYQDTNATQNELVVRLGQGHGNVCVVGDSDQSVYSFRGADHRNFLGFSEAFPEATTVVLDQNYRSTSRILNAANAVISNNQYRQPKDLWTDAGEGEPIRRYEATDEHDEARFVAHEVARLRDTGEVGWGEMAVFYRTNAQSRAVEEELVRTGVPYKVIGGTRFYDRREIKDVLAYVKAATNPFDEVSLKRVLNVPKRGVGDTTVGTLEQWAAAHGVTFNEALERSHEAGVGPRPGQGIGRFLVALAQVREAAKESAAAAIEVAIERTGYQAELRAEGTIESEGRLENIEELLNVAAEAGGIDEFLEQVSLVADTDALEAERGDETSVVLMTLHSAKGLEYPVVFLLGLEDGVFPHMNSLGDPHQLEEERRLCYVGITRAQRRLYLCNAEVRMLHGSSQYNPPSRFLKELPAELLDDVTPPRRHGRRSGGGWSRHGRGLGRRRSRDSDDGGGWGDPDDQPAGRTFGGGRGHQALVDSAVAAGHRNSIDTGGQDLGLQPGDRVRHGTWGVGTVVETEGSGDKAEALVRFPSVGDKRLLLSWAPLDKVE